MIELIAAMLVTPASLAMPPSNVPAIGLSYDWQAQKSVSLTSFHPDEDQFRVGATLNGTRSFVGSQLTIDDWNSD